MSYPTLTARRATEVVERLLKADPDKRVDLVVPEADLVVLADGDDYPREMIEAAATRLRQDWKSKVSELDKLTADDLYLLEILFSPKIYEALEFLSVDHREDEGFWRYLALFPFRWYLLAREGADLKPQNYGGLVSSRQPVPTAPDDHSDGTTPAPPDAPFVNQIMYRAFAIGRAIVDAADPADPHSRAKAIPRTGPVTDFWHSHVLRVQIGRIGTVPHALVDAVSQVKLEDMKDYGRDLAKAITRLKSNVVLDVYDKTELDAVVSSLP